MRVELKQVTGKMLGDPDGPDVPVAVDMVRLDGRSVATIGRHDGASVCFIANLAEEARKEVVSAVARLRAEKGQRVSAKDVAAPVVPPELYDDADDDGEDDEQ